MELIRKEAQGKLPEDCELWADVDGICISVPCKRTFKAKTLKEAIDDVNSWIDMLTRADEDDCN